MNLGSTSFYGVDLNDDVDLNDLFKNNNGSNATGVLYRDH